MAARVARWCCAHGRTYTRCAIRLPGYGGSFACSNAAGQHASPAGTRTATCLYRRRRDALHRAHGAAHRGTGLRTGIATRARRTIPVGGLHKHCLRCNSCLAQAATLRLCRVWLRLPFCAPHTTFPPCLRFNLAFPHPVLPDVSPRRPPPLRMWFVFGCHSRTASDPRTPRAGSGDGPCRSKHSAYGRL